MRPLLWGALAWAMTAQAAPLSLPDLHLRALPGLERLRTEALLAERGRALAGTRGLLREGPSVGLAAGPRTQPRNPATTDRSLEVDLPLFLAPDVRRRLESALGRAEPVLRRSAEVEGTFRLRCAYLDAWLAQELLGLREVDLATARAWLKAAVARREAGADPAFQASLVEGEILRAQLDLVEARQRRDAAWGALRALAELPAEPLELADPGEGGLSEVSEVLEVSEASEASKGSETSGWSDLRGRFEKGVLRRALALRQDLDREALRHQEAVAGSRWSLRGSYGREGEERIAKVGLAYRLGRPGEAGALARETEAGLALARREAEMAQVDLEARFRSALERLRTFPAPADVPDVDRALKAVGLRLEEGRERPSEALPIRRQLLETRATALRRRHGRQALLAELAALTEPLTPTGARP